jgi:hypothetical protein
VSVWFATPSCRPAAEASKVLDMWRFLGYRIALLRQGEAIAADLAIETEQYLGWARSVNTLAAEILARDPEAQWIVSGGDDYHPDLAHTAEDIGRQCSDHFAGTLGVMQPTGDRWGVGLWPADVKSATIDRIAGSPWLGREWCRRAYRGAGPMCAQYFHNYADEELQNVATRAGLFWQRPDLIQYHAHWARSRGSMLDRPKFAEYINGAEYYEAQAVFAGRVAAGYPGSELAEA